MTEDDWYNIDTAHIVQPNIVMEFQCGNCRKNYWFVRDRCPFCGKPVSMFSHDNRVYMILNGNVYVKKNGVMYVYDSREDSMVPVNESKFQRSSSGFPGISSMLTTTIGVLILFIIFVIIVAFLDETFFGDA